MINKTLFAHLQKTLEQHDTKRELIIRESRDALKLSKKAIYSIHRADIARGHELLASAHKHLAAAKKHADNNPHLLTTGAYLEAQEEFAEASFYHAFTANQKFPTPETLGVDHDQYLSGMCDLVGELVRAGINAAINEQYDKTRNIKELIAGIYAELMKFDFRNSPLRRKFDSIKYGLEKLEDVILDLKLRDKL